MYGYSVSPSGIHAVWGEFKAAHTQPDAATGAEWLALGRTLENLRKDFPSCLVLLHENPPSELLTKSRVQIKSRYGLSEHNGRLARYPDTTLHLLDVSDVRSLNYQALVSRGYSAAALFLTNQLPLEEVKQEFENAVGVEALRATLIARVGAYLGFDHDAFFTFETRRAALVRDILRDADVSERP